MKKTNFKTKNVVAGLVDYLSEKGDVKLLPEVAQRLDKIIHRLNKSDEIEVTSAVSLKPDQLDFLKERLTNILKINLPIKNHVDKKLLGGFTVRVSDWFLDASLSSELAILKRKLTL